MAKSGMHRREALQKMALLLGGTLSFPVQAALRGKKLNAVSIDIPPDYRVLIAHMAEVIMPQTATPGAKQALVDSFIVRVIEDCSSEDERNKFLEGLQKTQTMSQHTFGKPFTQLDKAGQTQVMEKIAREHNAFFQSIRELTIVGFFTSEVGATQVLQYLPIPGRFEGDVPLMAGQRTWAT